MTVNKRVFPID